MYNFTITFYQQRTLDTNYDLRVITKQWDISHSAQALAWNEIEWNDSFIKAIQSFIAAKNFQTCFTWQNFVQTFSRYSNISVFCSKILQLLCIALVNESFLFRKVNCIQILLMFKTSYFKFNRYRILIVV